MGYQTQAESQLSLFNHYEYKSSSAAAQRWKKFTEETQIIAYMVAHWENERKREAAFQLPLIACAIYPDARDDRPR